MLAVCCCLLLGAGWPLCVGWCLLVGVCCGLSDDLVLVVRCLFVCWLCAGVLRAVR